MPSAIAHISHIHISLQCKIPHHVRASHSVHSKILYAPHLGYLSMKQDIWPATTLNELLMTAPPLFKGQYTGTGIQDPHESDSVGLGSRNTVQNVTLLSNRCTDKFHSLAVAIQRLSCITSSMLSCGLSISANFSSPWEWYFLDLRALYDKLSGRAVKRDSPQY
jgi:hypothetical protein